MVALYEMYDVRANPVREICEVFKISKKTLHEYLKRRPAVNQTASG